MSKSRKPDDSMNLRVSREVWLNVKLRAVHEGITMRELVERALHQSLMAQQLGPVPPALSGGAGQTGKTITITARGWNDESDVYGKNLTEKHWTDSEDVP